ncbi:hypothetical protein [Pinirhizobacter soli]|uniref:hypothetical protein n=1 Tax=Pinirhizobacter soli TaxID=2786953 RepID=UPI002029C7C2|nr:hypothetical protein [Pinirhizobacter soli]
MPRKKTYSEVKLFYSIVVGHVFDLSKVGPEDRPVAVLERFEREDQKVAARALRIGVNDVLGQIAGGHVKDLRKLQRELTEAGALSLSDMLASHKARIEKVVLRGKVRNDDEFYLLREISESSEISEELHDRINKLLDTYEFG